MPKSAPKNAADYIVPLNINGLEGRMLKMAAPKSKKREMLLLYGSHANIERAWALAAEFNKYGSVTLPDLPGMGGMDSLYKLGLKPTLDNMADYLASFITMRYKKRRFTIIAISYSFLVVTRMLQKYPEIAKRVEFVVSVAGFAHHEDFKLPRRKKVVLKYGSLFFRNTITSKIARAAINKHTVTFTYNALSKSNPKMKDANEEELKERVAFETVLWRVNDMRTYFYTNNSMFSVDLCNTRAHAKVYHLSVGDDQYFDNYLVEQHLKVIYDKVNVLQVDAKAHMPTVIATPEDVKPFIPSSIRRILARA